MKEPVRERVVRVGINGRAYQQRVSVSRNLADFLRDDLDLTGTHVGCEHGVCGSCTVLLDGEPVRSCLLLAVQADGAEISTVEGLAEGDTATGSGQARLHPIQEAFRQHHGLQCGFCTPGILMTTVAYLREVPRPSEAQIREMLSGNLCRCTGYQGIVEAIQAAAAEMHPTVFTHSEIEQG